MTTRTSSSSSTGTGSGAAVIAFTAAGGGIAGASPRKATLTGPMEVTGTEEERAALLRGLRGRMVTARFNLAGFTREVTGKLDLFSYERADGTRAWHVALRGRNGEPGESGPVTQLTSIAPAARAPAHAKAAAAPETGLGGFTKAPETYNPEYEARRTLPTHESLPLAGERPGVRAQYRTALAAERARAKGNPIYQELTGGFTRTHGFGGEATAYTPGNDGTVHQVDLHYVRSDYGFRTLTVTNHGSDKPLPGYNRAMMGPEQVAAFTRTLYSTHASAQRAARQAQKALAPSASTASGAAFDARDAAFTRASRSYHTIYQKALTRHGGDLLAVDRDPAVVRAGARMDAAERAMREAARQLRTPRP